MAGKVQNIKVSSSLKLRSGLTGKKPAICHYSYNLPLVTTSKFRIKGIHKKDSTSNYKYILPIEKLSVNFLHL